MEIKVSFLYCISHGDCAVIIFEEDGDRKCIVVDGGNNKDSARALRDHLVSEEVERVDLMVGTHIDSDHIQGLYRFIENELSLRDSGGPYISVSQFWGPTPSEDRIPGVTGTSAPAFDEPDEAVDWQRHVIQSVKQNDTLFDTLRKAGVPILHPALDALPDNPFGSVRIEIIGPDTQIPADTIKKKALGLTTRASTGAIRITDLESLRMAISHNFQATAQEADRTANNQSIVFRLTPAGGVPPEAAAWSFLFTGDAEAEAWETMLGDSSVAGRLPARVLKIPHHGSDNGITEEGAKKVGPDYGIVCVGEAHGLPDGAGLRKVQSQGSQILCTRQNTSSSHKSDCYSVPAAECPAHGEPRTITFAIDSDTGECKITPCGRACQHRWEAATDPP